MLDLLVVAIFFILLSWLLLTYRRTLRRLDTHDEPYSCKCGRCD